AVDDVVVAVLDGPRLHGGEVGAGAGFGEALAPDVVALDDAREVLLLLLLGAVEDDGRAGPAGADAEVAPAWRAGERHLLREDELLHDGHAGAAVLLRPGRGDPAAVGELLHPLAVALEVFGTVHVDVVPAAATEGRAEAAPPDAGRTLVLNERAHFGAEGGFFGRVAEVHLRQSSISSGQAPQRRRFSGDVARRATVRAAHGLEVDAAPEVGARAVDLVAESEHVHEVERHADAEELPGDHARVDVRADDAARLALVEGVSDEGDEGFEVVVQGGADIGVIGLGQRAELELHV